MAKKKFHIVPEEERNGGKDRPSVKVTLKGSSKKSESTESGNEPETLKQKRKSLLHRLDPALTGGGL